MRLVIPKQKDLQKVIFFIILAGLELPTMGFL